MRSSDSVRFSKRNEISLRNGAFSDCLGDLIKKPHLFIGRNFKPDYLIESVVSMTSYLSRLCHEPDFLLLFVALVRERLSFRTGAGNNSRII